MQYRIATCALIVTSQAPPPAMPIPEHCACRFFAAFMIAACCMCIAYVVFLAGTPRYTHKAPGGDSLRGLCYYIWQSAWTSRKGLVALTGWIVLVLFIILSIAQVCALAALSPRPSAHTKCATYWAHTPT